MLELVAVLGKTDEDMFLKKSTELSDENLLIRKYVRNKKTIYVLKENLGSLYLHLKDLFFLNDFSKRQNTEKNEVMACF